MIVKLPGGTFLDLYDCGTSWGISMIVALSGGPLNYCDILSGLFMIVTLPKAGSAVAQW